MTQYNTDRFYVLRKVVEGDLPESLAAFQQFFPHETVDKLRTFGAAAQSSQDAFRRAGLGVWDALAELDEANNPFALPPRYDVEFITQEFDHAMDMLYSLNKLDKAPGDHRVFHGLKGTGKTMFLHVIGAVASCLLETTLPIYWTYERSSSEPPTPLQLARAAEKLVLFGGLFDKHIADVKKREKGDEGEKAGVDTQCTMQRPLLLLLDEFTTLYYPVALRRDAEVMREKGRNIMGQLVSIGKQRNTVIALVASHHDIHRYVHASQSQDFSTYPDLNNGVYLSRAILPLRDIAQIQEYFLRRHGVQLSEQEASEAFRCTGGVGRWMANWHNSRGFKPDSCLQKIVESNLLFRLCAQMVTGTERSTEISYKKAVQLLDHDVRLLEQCCDEMIFVRVNHVVDFVCPAIAEEFRRSLEHEENLHYATVLYLTHTGFQKGSAVHSNEWLVCKYMHEFFGIEPHDVSDDISITNGTTTFELSPNDPGFNSRYCDKLLKWNSEAGIDGFWLRHSADTLYVSALRLKTGRSDLKITPGVLTTQRRHRQKGSKVDDTTIAGVLAKAERGLAELVNAFSEQLASLGTPKQIEFDQFYLLTDQQAVSFQEFKHAHSSNRATQAQDADDLDDEFFIDGALRCSASNSSFIVHVRDYHSKWMNDVLPREVVQVAYPELCSSTSLRHAALR